MKSPTSPPLQGIQGSKLGTPAQEDGLPSSPRTPKKTPLAFTMPSFRSPRQHTSGKAKDHSDELVSGSGSLSAPVTPRSDSPTADDILTSSSRRRFDSSPQKLSAPVYRKPGTPIEILPSPRDAESGLLALGNEVAGLIFAEMKATKSMLTRETIGSLARYEIQVPVDKMSSALHLKFLPGGGKTLSHAHMIKALFQPRLLDTQIGKTLVAMRKMVMMLYDGDTLTLADRARIEENDLGFKKRMQANIEQQAKACAAIALGIIDSAQTPSLTTSKLPVSLINFWIAMDRKLCEWAAMNPELDASSLRTARENLSFDILVTRLILPVALGSETESHLVIPMMFFEAVKNALKAEWSAFFDSFIVASENRTVATTRPEITSVEKDTSGSVCTTTAVTSTTVSSTTVTLTTTTVQPGHRDATMN